MPNIAERLLVVGIFLALEVPLAAIAYKASRRARPLFMPGILLLLAALTPEPNWGGVFLLVSLFWMFALAIGARIRKTQADERRQLITQGPSPWLGQSRAGSLALIALGAVAMLSGTVGDAEGKARAAAILLVAFGSFMLGLGLFRRHTVLVLYLGQRRARWAEVVQVSLAVLAYALVAGGEFFNDPSPRLTWRLVSLVPFALHVLFVWVPLAKAQERQLLPETPYV